MNAKERAKYFLEICRIGLGVNESVSLVDEIVIDIGNVQGFIRVLYVVDTLKIVVYFHGTNELADLGNDVNILLDHRDSEMTHVYGHDHIFVHKGFYDAYVQETNGVSIKSFLHSEIPKLADAYLYTEIVFVGHSFGATIAIFAAIYFQNNHPDLGEWVRLVTFGSPKVGSQGFVDSLEKLEPNFVSFENGNDIVVGRPGYWLGYRKSHEAFKIGFKFPFGWLFRGVHDHKLESYEQSLQKLL